MSRGSQQRVAAATTSTLPVKLSRDLGKRVACAANTAFNKSGGDHSDGITISQKLSANGDNSLSRLDSLNRNEFSWVVPN
jgi:hypothetical protein